VGKLTVSHRYNRVSLLPSDPGEFQQELVAQDLPGDKSRKICNSTKKKIKYIIFLIHPRNHEEKMISQHPE